MNLTQLAFNALWILGCSLLLATVSLARAYINPPQHTWQHVLATPKFQTSICLGMLTICVGLLGLGDTWLDIGIWGGLAIAFAFQALRCWQAS